MHICMHVNMLAGSGDQDKKLKKDSPGPGTGTRMLDSTGQSR